MGSPEADPLTSEGPMTKREKERAARRAKAQREQFKRYAIEARARARTIAALEASGWDALRDVGTIGALLFSFADALFGGLKPSQVDAGRKNGLQWLRRRAAQGRRYRGKVRPH